MKRIKIKPNLVDQINITPMMDAALVLLVIFVIISPIIGRGISVKLPAAGGEKLPVTATVILTVDQTGNVYLAGRPVELADLSANLRSLKSADTDLKVIVQADRAVRYEYVVSVLDIVRQSGLTAVGLATTPPAPKKK